MTLTEKLAHFIKETSYEKLPEDVVGFTKLCILDWLGSAIAGKEQPPIQMMKEFVNDMGGNEQATLITGGKSSIVNASLVNGAASHVVELDDIHKQSIIHAATVVIPAAVSTAEAYGKTGKDLITAVAVGYDVAFRIGEAVSPSHYYYWHNTATCGTFGAAAACAKLLELNEEQTVHALGSAGTQAAGLWEFIEDGAMSKQLHPAKAAANGVISALLAEKGFTAAKKVLEGRRGFFKAMSEQADETKITERLGESYKITENSFKIHASCRHTHPAIDIIQELNNHSQLNIDDIDFIEARVYQSVANITDNPDPDTIYASKFSLQFCTGMAIVKGTAGLRDFNENTLYDEAIRSVMPKVKVIVDPEVDGQYPEKWGTKLDIHLKSGDVIHRETEYPKGDPEKPVTAEELIDKFKMLSANLSKDQRNAYVERLLKLEELESMKQFFVHEAGVL